MSILEHFKNQSTHIRDGKDSWFVIINKSGAIEVLSIPVAEIETFLEGTTFQHLAGMIPRFDKLPTKKTEKAHGKS